MENKILEFPKKQSLKKRLEAKAQEQKAALSLSIASVLVVSLFLNQWLLDKKDSSSSAGSRQIASFEGARMEDMKWEQSLARELAQKDLKDNARVAQKPTLRDNMVFGFLQGKYGMKLQNEQVVALEFIQNGQEPLSIVHKNQFLLDHQKALGLDFAQVGVLDRGQHQESYQLIDARKTIVGSAIFKMDDQGRVLSVKIQR